MNKLSIFVIRSILAVVFAVILMRFFHPELNVVYVIGLGAFLAGLAYLFEYFRNRKPKPGKPGPKKEV
jgi:uncharacterized membrane protein HdeD (DUF308 family)